MAKTKTLVKKKTNAAARRTTKRSAVKPTTAPPLSKTLGIKPDSTLTLLGEPPHFLKTLGKLPNKLKIRKTAQGERDLTVWFPRDAAELTRRIESLTDGIADGSLWIAWPNPSSEYESDLTQTLVRKIGLQHGIVDCKSCAIDETFTGLNFTKTKK